MNLIILLAIVVIFLILLSIILAFFKVFDDMSNEMQELKNKVDVLNKINKL